jgi:hypothetical protein
MPRTNDPCPATKPHPSIPDTQWHCNKRADHVTKAGRYARQHMDSKNSPVMYWDATPEEIANYKSKADANAT